MKSGPIYRRPKHETSYKMARANVTYDACPFCTLESDGRKIIAKTRYFVRITNIFPYEMWDGRSVTKHELLVPRRHVTGLHDFTPSEQRELASLLAEADEQGYSFFGRHDGSNAKTVLHQHTHLIMTEEKPLRHIIYIRKPHILFLGKHH